MILPCSLIRSTTSDFRISLSHFRFFTRIFFLRVVVKHCKLFIYTVLNWNITYLFPFQLHISYTTGRYIRGIRTAVYLVPWYQGIIRRIIWYLMFIRYVFDRRMNTSIRSWYDKPCLRQLSEQVIAGAYRHVHFWRQTVTKPPWTVQHCDPIERFHGRWNRSCFI